MAVEGAGHQRGEVDEVGVKAAVKAIPSSFARKKLEGF